MELDESLVPSVDEPGASPTRPGPGMLLPSATVPMPESSSNVGAPCTSDAQCTGQTVCSAAVCLPPCSSNAECAASGLVCDPAVTRCVECLADADCAGGGSCQDRSCSATLTPPEPAPAEPVPAEPDVGLEPAPEPVADDDVAPEPADDDIAPEPVPVEDPPTDADGCTLAIADPCSAGIPAFSGTQQVDGDDGEFCDVPIAVLDLSSAPLTVGDTSGLPHKAEIRVAWSPEALHLFARITDPTVLPEGTPDSWSGDSLDVYVASTTETSGNLGDDGTPQLILAPPGGDHAASAMRFPAQEGLSSGYAALTTDEGYVVELSYPWPGGASLSAGSTIRINFAMNVREVECTDFSDLNACRQYYGAYTYTSPGDGSPCSGFSLPSGRSAEPWCDNRTWCPATLQ